MAFKQDLTGAGRTDRTQALTRRFLRLAIAGGLASLLFAPLSAYAASEPAASPTATTGDAPTAQDVSPPPVRAVILVDESGSLDAADVQEEKVAAQVLAFGMLSGESEVAVVGFGSSNGPGQVAAETACPLTRVDPSKQDFFVSCIDKLHRREPNEGGDTDHVSALSQALSILDAPGGDERTKLVFLLTDGVLDVSDSPQYGGQPSARNSNAQVELTREIANARDADVQIWPLGFGQADQAALDKFAEGGAQQSCSNLDDNQPRARIATTSDAVAETLFAAIGSANCAETTSFDSDDLTSGSQVELTVNIPEISTDGLIVVLKGDSRVGVTYVDPNGKEVPSTGTFDDSTFTASTTSGTVETLRIQNPRPGTWTVRLRAGTDVPDQLVAAAAMWQGVLQAVVSLDPITPQAGEQAVVRVRLQTRDGAVSDPNLLEGITFGARMSGDSVENTNIALTDDGRNGDVQAGDSVYAGTVQIPEDAEGLLEFRGTVDGPGVIGAQTPLFTTVSSGPPPVIASITMDRGPVEPGGRLEGKVVVDNADGTPRRLRLELRDLAPGVLAELSEPNIVESPRAGRVEQAFAVTFDENSKEGTAGGKIRLVDAADANLAYEEAFFSVDVAIPDPLWARLWWLWLLLFVALAALAAVLARVRHASLTARGVGNITVHLSRAGSPLSHLRAPDSTGTRFPFTIHDAQGFAPRLDNAYGNVARPYVVTRNRHGQVEVRTPDGTVHTLSPRTPVAVEHGLALTFSDAGAPGGAGGGPEPFGAAGRRRGGDPYEDAADPYSGSSSSDAPTADPYASQPFGGPSRARGNTSDADETRPSRRRSTDDNADATTVIPGGEPRPRSSSDETHRVDGRPSMTKGRPPRSGARNDELLD